MSAFNELLREFDSYVRHLLRYGMDVVVFVTNSDDV